MIERPYNYKPHPRFFGPGDTYFGIELEVEAPCFDKKAEGLEAAGNPNWCYAKRDGSLAAAGWEMVTHPISMNFWLNQSQVADYHDVPEGTVLTGTYKGVTYTATMMDSGRVEWEGTVYRSISAAGKAITGTACNGYKFFGLIPEPNPTTAFFSLVAKLKDLGYTSHDSGRCGFHVHISKKAFNPDGDIRSPMFFSFKVLVNGSLFAMLSQRTSFQYCQQEPVSEYNFCYNNRGRYAACNITDKTVEVRIFRGNLREDRLRKNIEAVMAAIEFSKRATDYTPPTDADFVNFVNANAQRFPNLARYITDHATQPVEVHEEQTQVPAAPALTAEEQAIGRNGQILDDLI